MSASPIHTPEAQPPDMAAFFLRMSKQIVRDLQAKGSTGIDSTGRDFDNLYPTATGLFEQSGDHYYLAALERGLITPENVEALKKWRRQQILAGIQKYTPDTAVGMAARSLLTQDVVLFSASLPKDGRLEDISTTQNFIDLSIRQLFLEIRSKYQELGREPATPAHSPSASDPGCGRRKLDQTQIIIAMQVLEKHPEILCSVALLRSSFQLAMLRAAQDVQAQKAAGAMDTPTANQNALSIILGLELYDSADFAALATWLALYTHQEESRLGRQLAKTELPAFLAEATRRFVANGGTTVVSQLALNKAESGKQQLCPLHAQETNPAVEVGASPAEPYTLTAHCPFSRILAKHAGPDGLFQTIAQILCVRDRAPAETNALSYGLNITRSMATIISRGLSQDHPVFYNLFRLNHQTTCRRSAALIAGGEIARLFGPNNLAFG